MADAIIAAPKLSRQQTQERRALGRDLQKTLRAGARKAGWGCARGGLFRDDAGWFVEVRPMVSLSSFEMSLQLHTKPMLLDPLFWQIVLLPENTRLPLSFRAAGAWTCHTPPMTETMVADPEHRPESLAAAVFAWADEQMAQNRRKWTVSTFIDHVQQTRNGWYFPAEVTALILAGRADEARAACLNARSRRETGTFIVVGSGSFVDLALAHLGDAPSADAPA